MKRKVSSKTLPLFRAPLARLQAAALIVLMAHPLGALGAAPTGNASLPARESNTLPALGDAGIMTPPQERRLGDLIAKDLYADTTYMDDPIIGEYVDGVWRRLLAGAQARGELTPELTARYTWRLALMRDSEVNAFAMPGGYMGLNLGLIGVVESRDELASVLAHEMSHTMQRHIARLIAAQSRETPLMLAAIVAGILAGVRNPQIGTAVIAGGQAAQISRELSFSRDMEREADRIGYGVFVQSGYAPWGFVSMFEKLQVAARLNDNGDWPLLRDHPLTSERIADMQERQRSLEGRPKPATDWEALLIAARARVLARPGVDVLRTWASIPLGSEFAKQSAPKKAAQLYAAAMAQVRLHDIARAQALVKELAQLAAGNPPAERQTRLLSAEIAIAAGQSQAALYWLSSPGTAPPTGGGEGTVLEMSDASVAAANAGAGRSGAVALGMVGMGGGLSGSDPNLVGYGSASSSSLSNPANISMAGRAALLLRASAALQAGGTPLLRLAASDLQTWVSGHGEDALAWQTLAQADNALGLKLRALRAEGEARLAMLDYTGAIDRWRAAQDYSRKHQSANEDLIEASIVNARLVEAREALKRQKETEKKYN